MCITEAPGRGGRVAGAAVARTAALTRPTATLAAATVSSTTFAATFALATAQSSATRCKWLHPTDGATTAVKLYHGYKRDMGSLWHCGTCRPEQLSRLRKSPPESYQDELVGTITKPISAENPWLP